MFAGSLLGFNTSIKNNKNLLGKRKRIFDQPRSFAEMRELFRQAKAKHGAYPKASPELLLEIRAKIEAENKKRFAKAAIIFSLLIGSATVGVVYISQTPSIYSEMVATYRPDLPTPPMSVDPYPHYLAQGDTFLEKQQWFLAIGYYQAALEAKPLDKTAMHQLALAYTHWCTEDDKRCLDAAKYCSNYLVAYPNDSEIELLLVNLPSAE
jgi:tetratricopeptide (TPR) repeat protein